MMVKFLAAIWWFFGFLAVVTQRLPPPRLGFEPVTGPAAVIAGGIAMVLATYFLLPGKPDTTAHADHT